jgi:hypothetical protein
MFHYRGAAPIFVTVPATRPIMTVPKSPKKSETIEVRIPHPTKSAFMEKARAEGRGASEIVREQIDLYLRDTPPAPTLRSRLPQHLRGLGLLFAGAASALALSLFASPASALPDPKAAFAILDIDGDGLLSPAEFARLDSFRRLDTDGNGLLSPDEF